MKWLQHREEEKIRVAAPREVDVPVAFVPHDLPVSRIGVGDSSSASEDIQPLSMLRNGEFPPDTVVDTRVSDASSHMLSISTFSDLTPNELDARGSGGERKLSRHQTFYLEDGNVEIVCGQTIFRIHSPVILFSSSKLRDMLSQSALLDAPTPGGCPRVVFDDSAEDFAVLLKMIYTPG